MNKIENKCMFDQCMCALVQNGLYSFDKLSRNLLSCKHLFFKRNLKT